MDKYQRNLLNKISFVVKEEGASFSISDVCATAVQPENAYIEEIQVTVNSSVLKCIIVDGVKIEIVNNSALFTISFKNDNKQFLSKLISLVKVPKQKPQISSKLEAPRFIPIPEKSL